VCPIEKKVEQDKAQKETPPCLGLIKERIVLVDIYEQAKEKYFLQYTRNLIADAQRKVGDSIVEAVQFLFLAIGVYSLRTDQCDKSGYGIEYKTFHYFPVLFYSEFKPYVNGRDSYSAKQFYIRMNAIVPLFL